MLAIHSHSTALQNTYHGLGEQFYTEQLPTPVLQPALICLNHGLAESLNLDIKALDSPEGLQVLAGNAVAEGSYPIATVYAGHQFGGWSPQLGDGRAILLGEASSKDNKLYDIQLKGAGQTPYSRMGDGRSPLGPVLREYIVSEAMTALGIPSTRSLAAVTTGERVVREVPLTGAILTRVAQSHIRVGTFQYFAARQDLESIQQLADYVIDRHFKDTIDEHFKDDRYGGLFFCVAQAQARLIAHWMSVGFIHGVMNTDNMLVCGETVDYGPCAFMDGFNPNKVFSSIDSQGRYAYANQPNIARWNLGWLAQALLPLMDDSESVALTKAEQILQDFVNVYEAHYQTLMAEKLGFCSSSDESAGLIGDLMQLMAKDNSDFTLTFRGLGEYLVSGLGEHSESLDELCNLSHCYEAWLGLWKAALQRQGVEFSGAYQQMIQVNPVYIPRNHRIEAAIESATFDGDFSLFHQLLDVLSQPYKFSEETRKFAQGPTLDEEILHTFCGT